MYCILFYFQYYYNPQTQQYLYWDSEKQTYVPADANAAGTVGDSAANASSGKDTKDSKDKKEKPKSKTAQQVRQ